MDTDPLAGLILTEGPDGVTLSLRIIPRAKRSAVDGVAEGALRLRIAAPPVEGAANKAVIAFLAAILGLPKREIALIAGEQNRRKVVRIRGMHDAQIRQRLREHGSG